MRYLFIFILITVFTSSVSAQSSAQPTAWPGWATVQPFPADLTSQIPFNTRQGTHTFSGYGYIFGAFKSGWVTVYVKEITAQGAVYVKPEMIDVSSAQTDENDVPKIGSQLVQSDAKGNMIVITIIQLTRSAVLKGNSDTDVNNKLNWGVHPYRLSVNSGW